MYYTKILLSTCFLIFGLTCFGQQFTPKIDTPKSDLAIFLAELDTALQHKDSDFIYGMLASDIMNGFGGNGGIAEFKEYWNNLNTNSAFWAIMPQILKFGGNYEEDNTVYTVPYVFSNWPGHETYNVFEHLAVTGTKVNVRDKPNTETSTVLGQLSYCIVKFDYDRTEELGELSSWSYVMSTNSNLEGYMHNDYLWSPINYRASFHKINGQWKLTYLVAGD